MYVTFANDSPRAFRFSRNAETALQLEQVLHIPASFWLKLEQDYRESLAHLAEEQRLLPRGRPYSPAWKATSFPGNRPERERRKRG